MYMKKKLFIWIPVVILVLTAFYIVKMNNQKNVKAFAGNQNTLTNGTTASQSTNAGKVKAIDFKLKDLNGKEVSLKDFKGKKVFLNFWASWCPPCKAEMPDIEKLYQETKDTDLVILAVDLGEDTPTVKNFISKNKYDFNVLLDSDQNVGRMYSITSIPTSFFIDKDGNIINKRVGAMTLEDMKMYISTIK